MARLANACAFALAFASLAGSATAATLQANPANVKAVLAAAKGGDTVVLAAGEYVPQGIARKTFQPPLVIDGRAAVMIGWQIGAVSGVTFKGGVFRVPPPVDSRKKPGTLVYGMALRFDSVSHMRVTDATFEGPGDLTQNPPILGEGIGLLANTGEDITLANSRFTGLSIAASFGNVDGLNVLNNVSTGARSDGFKASSSHHALFEGNECSGTMIRGGEHPDCIQLWSRPPLPPTSDIIIRRNKVTGNTQGIGLFNHVRAGVDDGGFDRVLIEDNDIYVGLTQGIGMNGSRNSIVRNNRLRTTSDARHQALIRVDESVIRCGNVVGPGGGKPGSKDNAC